MVPSNTHQVKESGEKKDARNADESLSLHATTGEKPRLFLPGTG